MALLAIWIYGISHLTSRPTPPQVAWALLPIALLVVVKPEFELLLVAMVVVLVVGIWKTPWSGTGCGCVCRLPDPGGDSSCVDGVFHRVLGLSKLAERGFAGTTWRASRLRLDKGVASPRHGFGLPCSAMSRSSVCAEPLRRCGRRVLPSLKENSGGKRLRAWP